jgi:hypothetical protein
MSNASIKAEKTYTITAGGKEFAGWRRVERWNGFARVERGTFTGKEFAIIADPDSLAEMLNIEDKTTVLRTDCRDLIQALEKRP